MMEEYTKNCIDAFLSYINNRDTEKAESILISINNVTKHNLYKIQHAENFEKSKLFFEELNYILDNLGKVFWRQEMGFINLIQFPDDLSHFMREYDSLCDIHMQRHVFQKLNKQIEQGSS